MAITRAKQTLTISHARQRMLYGRTNAALASRFLKEIPEEDLVFKGSVQRVAERSSYGNYGSFGGYGGFGDSAYRTQSPRSATQKPVRTSSFVVSASAPATYLEVNKGDMVQHTAFGKGMVLSVMKMGGDALLEIAFDQIGTKKLMAKTASAHMKKL